MNNFEFPPPIQSRKWLQGGIYKLTQEMVFCCQNCFNLLWEKSDREKLLKFEAEGQEFANFLRSLEQFIQTVKGQYNF